jgi:hypothetical protein
VVVILKMIAFVINMVPPSFRRSFWPIFSMKSATHFYFILFLNINVYFIFTYIWYITLSDLLFWSIFLLYLLINWFNFKIFLWIIYINILLHYYYIICFWGFKVF